jgi:hypothetical protein
MLRARERNCSIRLRGSKLRGSFPQAAVKKSLKYLRRSPRPGRSSSQRPAHQIFLSEEGSAEQLNKAIDGKLLRSHHLKTIDLSKLENLTDEEADDLLHTWELWARPNQLEPDAVLENGEHWVTWLILAGRGFGKTRCGAETVIKWVREGSLSKNCTRC